MVQKETKEKTKEFLTDVGEKKKNREANKTNILSISRTFLIFNLYCGQIS